MAKSTRPSTIVVSALQARTHFGKPLPRAEEEKRSVVIEKRGTAKAVNEASLTTFDLQLQSQGAQVDR